MKKIPNSPPNRLPNSPHPPEKSKKVRKKSTSQQVNESTSLGAGGGESVMGLLGSVMGLSWVRKQNTLFNPLNPISTYFIF